MFMLVEKQPPPEDDTVAKFWIDPSVEVALNAHINEQQAPPGEALPEGQHPQAEVALMDCYNCDSPE